MFDLVKATTKDGLILNGLFSQGEKKNPTVIHIHGFEGDFFNNKFINVIAKKLKKHGTNFLTVQTRGMGNDYDLTTENGQYRRYGAHFELLNEAYLDIDSWIDFLQKHGYNQTILQGHSLGTVKVIRYLFEGSYRKEVKKLILLSPFDNFWFFGKYATKGKLGKYLKKAKEKIKKKKGEEIVTKDFPGMQDLSYQSYLSWLENERLSRMFAFFDKNYSFPILKKIQIPVKVIVGTSDEYFHPTNPKDPKEAFNILKSNVKNFSGKLIENANHGFAGYEDVVADEVLNFVL